MKKLLCILLCVITTSVLLTSCSLEGNGATKPFDGDIKKIASDISDGNLEFAFEIFKELNNEDQDKSIFISPFSISTALSMTYNGAGSSTAEAMAKALKYEGVDIGVLNESYHNLIGYLNSIRDVELNIGNSIWIREGEDIKTEFLSVNRGMFGAQAAELDFSNEDAASTINKWILEATKKKIEKMIDSPIPDDIVMYLINAIYFKGQWAEQFDKKHSFDTMFHMEDGSTKPIKMMSRTGKVQYGSGDNFKAVRLPYGKGTTAMYCILPEEGTTINDYITQLNAKKWKQIKESLKETEDVLVQIPRFKMEYGIKELNSSLTAQGMGEAFSDNADFSGIRDGICISRVLHKAIIEVNEEGSEAAGATVVEMRVTGAALEPATFVADRPMLFVIMDEETGTILFMGKLFDIN